jgi:predicted nucleic acid-binding protein
MILLDTNVVSELMLPRPDLSVARWLDRQAVASLWITTISEMEVRYGIVSLGASRRRDALASAFDRFVSEIIVDRVAVFDVPAARAAAELMADGKRRGRPGEIRDTLIAGIASASNATVATRNVAHFADSDINVVNPWAGSGSS